MHVWTAKNWIQYSASHVAYTATTALLLSQNDLRSDLRASDFWGSMPPDPSSLAWLYMHTYTSNTHVTPLAKILAMGLNLTYYSFPLTYYFISYLLFVLCLIKTYNRNQHKTLYCTWMKDVQAHTSDCITTPELHQQENCYISRIYELVSSDDMLQYC